jgi:hypothetical protein
MQLNARTHVACCACFMEYKADVDAVLIGASPLFAQCESFVHSWLNTSLFPLSAVVNHKADAWYFLERSGYPTECAVLVFGLHTSCVSQSVIVCAGVRKAVSSDRIQRGGGGGWILGLRPYRRSSLDPSHCFCLQGGSSTAVATLQYLKFVKYYQFILSPLVAVHFVSESHRLMLQGNNTLFWEGYVVRTYTHTHTM